RDGNEKKDAAAPAAPGAGLGGFGGGKGAEKAKDFAGDGKADAKGDNGLGGPQQGPNVGPTVRKNFADTAFWSGTLNTNKDGMAEVSFAMPGQLSGWKIKVWAMGHGTKVGQGEVEVFTKKDLIVRMQAPRFFVQKDEVILSANVHNYLKAEK